MLQNLQLPDKLVAELVEIELKLTPLEARKEELKDALRSFGANSYNAGNAVVRVSEPSVPRLTGNRLALNEKNWSALSPGTQAECLNKHFVFREDVFSRAAKSRVEIILT